MMVLSKQSACRACGSTGLRLGLDLGLLPLANSVLSRQRASDPTADALYPLRVFRCENCGLIQLLDVVDQKEMFDDYVFLTSTAETTLLHFDRYAEELNDDRCGDVRHDAQCEYRSLGECTACKNIEQLKDSS